MKYFDNYLDFLCETYFQLPSVLLLLVYELRKKNYKELKRKEYPVTRGHKEKRRNIHMLEIIAGKFETRDSWYTGKHKDSGNNIQ